MLENNPTRLSLILLIVCLFFFSTPAQAFSLFKKKEKHPEPVKINAAQLQSQVMAFADRFVSILQGGFDLYRHQESSAENYKYVLNLGAYAMASAYTIASQPNPAGALLDMTTMVTLGRIICEENLKDRIGPQLAPVIAGFQKAEKDVWQILSPMITPARQQEFMAIIDNWRNENPNILFFPTVRFSDFSSFRGVSELGDQKSSGLFKSVEQAVDQVEEARLFAERGMYLATRAPLLTGTFGAVWFSQLANHPDVEKILQDLDRFSQVSERLAVVAEALPEKVAIERDATIKQAMETITQLSMMTIDETSKQTLNMIDETAKRISQEREAAIDQLIDEISSERKRITEDILNEEERIKGLVSELRLTLAEGNKLAVTADSIIKDLNLDAEKQETASPSEPFNVIDYKNTISEATNLVIQIHGLVETLNKMGFKKLLPDILSAVETFEKKGQKWVYLGFVLGIALITVFLTGAVVSALIYRYFANRIFDRKQTGGQAAPAT